MGKKKINIVYKEVGKKPTKLEIEDDLKSFQNLVGGYIQAVNIENDVCIICDEEGVLKIKQPNIQHKIYGTIVGNIFVVGSNIKTGKFVSLTEAQIEKYIKELNEIAIGKDIKLYENYSEMRKQQQKEFDKFPMMFAFDDEQFDEGMKKLGVTEEEQVISIGFGGFIRKSDVRKYNNMQDRFLKEFQHSIMADKTGEKFIKGMFIEEMRNHEYSYTKEIEPVFVALGLTMDTVNDFENLKHGLELAKKEYLENCNEVEEEFE